MNRAMRLLAVCFGIACGSWSESGHSQSRLPSIPPPVVAMAVSPNAKEIVVGSQAGLKILSLPQLEVTRVLATELEHIHDIAFSPDERMLAAVGGSPSENGLIEIYRWPEFALVQRIACHQDLIYCIDWRFDSQNLAVGSLDHRVSIFELGVDKPKQMLEMHSRGVTGVGYLPDGNGLVTSGLDDSIRLCDPSSGQLLRTLSNHTKPVTGLAVRPLRENQTPSILASIGLDHTVRFWQPTTGRMRFAKLSSAALDVVWLEGASAVAVACHDGMVRVVDYESVSILEEKQALKGTAYCLDVLPDRQLAVGGQGGRIRVVTLSVPP